MSWFYFALKFLPVILQAIRSIEEILGAEASGKLKKTLVMNAALASAKAGGPVNSKTVKMISELVDMTVASLNTGGAKKGDSPA